MAGGQGKKSAPGAADESKDGQPIEVTKHNDAQHQRVRRHLQRTKSRLANASNADLEKLKPDQGPALTRAPQLPLGDQGARLASAVDSDNARQAIADLKSEAKYTRGSQFSQSYYLIAGVSAFLAPVVVFMGASAVVGAVLSFLVGPIWMMVDGWSGRSDSTKHIAHETRLEHFKHMLQNPFKFAHKIFDVVLVGFLGLVSFVGVIALSILSKSFVGAMASVGTWFAPVGFGALALTAFMGAYRAYKASKDPRFSDPKQRGKEFREAIFNTVTGLGAVLLCASAIVALASPPGAIVAASVIAGLSVVGGMALAVAGIFKVKRMYQESTRLKPWVDKRLGRKTQNLPDEQQVLMKLTTHPVTRSSYESPIDTRQHDQEHGGLGAPIPRASTFSVAPSDANQNTSPRPRVTTVTGDFSHALSKTATLNDAGAGSQDAKNAEQSPAKSRWQNAQYKATRQATTPTKDIPVSNAKAEAIEQVVQNAGRKDVKGQDDEAGLTEESI